MGCRKRNGKGISADAVLGGTMIYKTLLIIFNAMGATFDFYMYKDTGHKGYLIPFLIFLLALILSIISMVISFT